MKKVLYVYKITNLINQKSYVGKHSSSKIENGYFGSGIAIKRSIKKHGKENHKKEILCLCNDEKELNQKEIYYIEKENTFKIGYNMTKGGEGALGLSPSAESILKISAGNILSYKNNPLRRERCREIARERVGEKNSFYGKKLSKEHIEKLRAARVVAITGPQNKSAVRLLCKETGQTFETAKDAAIFCKLSASTTILKCAKGQRKKAGGYTWEILPKNNISHPSAQATTPT